MKLIVKIADGIPEHSFNVCKNMGRIRVNFAPKEILCRLDKIQTEVFLKAYVFKVFLKAYVFIFAPNHESIILRNLKTQ